MKIESVKIAPLLNQNDRVNSLYSGKLHWAQMKHQPKLCWDLKWFAPLIELESVWEIYLYSACGKLYSNCSLGLRVKCIATEATQDIALAYCAVSNNDHFE